MSQQFIDFLKDNNFQNIVVSTLISIPISKFVDGLIGSFIQPRIEKLIGITLKEDDEIQALSKMILTLIITLTFVYLIFLYINK